MAARNLTMDRAPTKPRDNASEDFTIVIMSIVVIVSMRKFLPNNLLFDSEFPYRTYTFDKRKASKPANSKFNKKPKTGICILCVAKNS
jgi:hypothetical protein